MRIRTRVYYTSRVCSLRRGNQPNPYVCYMHIYARLLSFDCCHVPPRATRDHCIRLKRIPEAVLPISPTLQMEQSCPSLSVVYTAWQNGHLTLGLPL